MDKYKGLIELLRKAANVKRLLEQEGTYELLMQAADAIEELLEERKKGKWVQDDIASNIFRCSECGCDAPVEPTAGCEIKSNFCQWCGADMRCEQDE